MRRGLFFAFILAGGWAAAATGFGEPARPAAPVSVETRLSRRQVAIGEPFLYTVAIKASRETEIAPVPGEKKLGGADVLKATSRERRFLGRRTVIYSFELVAYEAGELPIVPVPVKYRPAAAGGDWLEVRTKEEKISVGSLLQGVAADKASLRDIKSPLGLRSARRVWWYLAAALLFGSLAAWFFRRRQEAQPPVPAPPRPAQEIAYEQLEALRRKDLIRQGMVAKYYIELSDIVRRYLENRFALRAPEMTTQEFLFHARQAAALKGDHQALVRDFLECCDLVKFAKYVPAADVAEEVFLSARKLVDETKAEAVVSQSLEEAA